MGGTVAVVILAIILFVAVGLQKNQKKAEMQTVHNNVRSTFVLMVEFDQDFGAFPNDASADADPDLAGLKGNYSNDYLAQLIAGGYVKSEELFYVPGCGSVNHYPDNVVSPPSKLLEAGECGLSMVLGSSTKHATGTPILLAPMTGNGLTFNPEPFGGKGLILRIDGGVKQLRLDSSGHADVGRGKTLFEGGSGTPWGSAGFDARRLKHPK